MLLKQRSPESSSLGALHRTGCGRSLANVWLRVSTSIGKRASTNWTTRGTPMIKVLATREREARYGRVFWRLWKRIFSHPKLECKVGQEQRQRRSDKCTACTVKTDLEIDHSVAKLISDGTIVCSTQCPYLVFTHALISALFLGPEAEETATESDRVRIIELNTTLRHIDRAVRKRALIGPPLCNTAPGSSHPGQQKTPQ